MRREPEHRFLTIAEAARLLRVHRRTVYRYLDAGKLPARKYGGVWLIDAEELERQLGVSG
jgi:excisionase family DNA binding protein